jgi:hypothetical protein
MSTTAAAPETIDLRDEQFRPPDPVRDARTWPYGIRQELSDEHGTERVDRMQSRRPGWQPGSWMRLGNLDRSYLTTLRAFGGLQSYPSRTKDPDGRANAAGRGRLPGH